MFPDTVNEVEVITENVSSGEYNIISDGEIIYKTPDFDFINKQTVLNNGDAKLVDDKLSELNKINTNMSLSLLCDYRVAKGKILNLNVPEYGLKGEYLITSCTHAITSCKDTASINIEKYVKN